MGREEKRRLARAETWINSLSAEKQEIIETIISNKVERNNKIMGKISDTCLVAALDDVLDVDISKIHDILVKNNEYLINYGEYLEKENEEGVKMIEDEGLKVKVKNKIKDYMSGKVDKASAMKILKNEFNLPYAELSDLWIECKSNSRDKKFLNNKKQNEGDAEMVKKTTLKIIDVITEIQGEHAVYRKSKDGVKVGDKKYASAEDVMAAKVMLESEYEMKMDAVQKKINELNVEFKNIQETGMKEVERLTEIVSIFEMC